MKFSATELRAKTARGESRSDLARVRAKTEAELERDIASDPDFAGISDDWLATAEAVRPIPKALLSLRIDADVIDWFKRQGPGYQSRMNAALRAYMQLKRK
ncbi:MAG TPA: BrnA antitoxin family protein [Acidiphilium sp.]